jgi:signal transduction histidine kinase
MKLTLTGGIVTGIVFLQLSFYSSLLAQTASPLQNLRQAVLQHPQKDTVRINRLNQLAIEARKEAPKESNAAAREALSLSRQLSYARGEAAAMLTFAFYYRFRGELDSALYYNQQAFQKWQPLKDTAQQLACLYNFSFIHIYRNDYAKAIPYSLQGLRLAEKNQNSKWHILFNTQLGFIFKDLGDYAKARQYYSTGLRQAQKAGDRDGIMHGLNGMAYSFQGMGMWKEAEEYYGRAIQQAATLHDQRSVNQSTLFLAEMKEKQGSYKEVISLVYSVLPVFIREDYGSGFLGIAHTLLARAHLRSGQFDSAIFYGSKAIPYNRESSQIESGFQASEALAEAYAIKGHYKEAYQYQRLSSTYRDSLNKEEEIRRTSALQYTDEIKQKEAAIALLTKNEELTREKNEQQRVLLFGTIGGLLLVGGLSVFLWRNNRAKQQAYARLQKQQEQLKATQQQLIQQEKMASLGELTAGIAHEIQNPLNFVNNFSSVNKELLTEMEEEMDKRNYGEVKAIVGDIKANEEKIAHHGRRADNIVKGMLLHARSSTGQKELTDINKLAEEYIRLAYQGTRAKDKGFHANIETDFDTAGQVPVVPEDIGRVLLNLFNNAFYALQEKKARLNGTFEPLVTVHTKRADNCVQIVVKDNGTGMPSNVTEKVFQPFFTTKPTGEGTGLGLSLSYDIITKGHGGTLSVHSKEGEGSEFVIQLPA